MALNYSERLDLFFDSHILGKRGQKWYELARLVAPEEYRRMLPSYIKWESDEEFLPLKSADLLAGLARRGHNNDVENLECIISRIDEIPIVQDSHPLEDAYFETAINAPPIVLEGAEFDEWQEKWRNEL